MVNCICAKWKFSGLYDLTLELYIYMLDFFTNILNIFYLLYSYIFCEPKNTATENVNKGDITYKYFCLQLY